jgi:hypothetical protein
MKRLGTIVLMPLISNPANQIVKMYSIANWGPCAATVVIKALSLMTFIVMTHNTKGLSATLGINDI